MKIRKPDHLCSARTLRRRRQEQRELGAAKGQKDQRKTRVANRPVTQLANPVAPPPPDILEERRKINLIGILVDDSYSMQHCRQAALDFANEQIANIKKVAHETLQDTRITLRLFSDRGRDTVIYSPTYFQAAAPLQQEYYRATGNATALHAAVKNAIIALAWEEAAYPDADVNVLLLVLTDGEENDSGPERGMARQIAEKRALGNWTFGFCGPRGCTRWLVRDGVPAGNIREWEGGKELRESSIGTVNAVSSYFQGTAKGVRSTQSLYTDLSGVKQQDLNQLQSVGHRYRRLQVDHDGAEIAGFVESKGHRYVPGIAFYELMKPEVVQDHKAVLLLDKRTKLVYGGAEAKKLLGITGGPGVNVRVKPGNHANFKVFVQSTSTNRKLSRGTELMVAQQY